MRCLLLLCFFPLHATIVETFPCAPRRVGALSYFNRQQRRLQRHADDTRHPPGLVSILYANPSLLKEPAAPLESSSPCSSARGTPPPSLSPPRAIQPSPRPVSDPSPHVATNDTPVPQAPPVPPASTAAPSSPAPRVHDDETDLPTHPNETHILIRRMSLKDVASVFHIGETVFSSESYPQLYRTWSPYEVTDNLSTDGEFCLVAEEVRKLPPKRGRRPKAYKEHTKQVVGFLLGSVTEKKKKQEGCAYLAWVAVNEVYQRQGIGTALVGAIEALFQREGMATVVADTPESNVPARRFLEKLGFGNPISHVYMSLNIANSKGKDGVKAPRKKKGAPKQKPVRVRQMDIDDLAKVYALGEEVFTQELYPNLYSIWSEAEVVELFGSDSDTCFVCEASDKTFMGFVLGTEIEKKGSSWRYGYLLWLAVSPKAQGLGVGRRLLKEFQDTMEENGCRLLLCDTQADNLAARAFFEKSGFQDWEDHVYYTKEMDMESEEEKRALVDETEGAEGKKVKKTKGMPQPRLTRLTKTKRVGQKTVGDKVK
ncbi:gcn5-related n-acetyltransferase [Nannochloropsis gaditana]|uniref:Gcn5-related n-acetyltransferase n=1 Tax=Nannochloropsis gaditana TaxID=72520 RepID=W7TJM9_9STRA|nr:gcn5-related n-acetyltransferase [Nannochloropsis gaditana]